jgi:hypothetical protein
MHTAAATAFRTPVLDVLKSLVQVFLKPLNCLSENIRELLADSLPHIVWK